MLTREAFVVRMATIMSEYMTVIDQGKLRKKDEFVVDGKRLLEVIENLTNLMMEVEPQVSWPNSAPLGFQYN